MQLLKIKLLFFLLTLLSIFFFIQPAQASGGNSFVSIVNPVRGDEFWNLPESPTDAIKGQIEILNRQNLPATFLIRYDAFKNSQITDLIKSSSFEKGLFLEITPQLAQASRVNYHQSSSWHNAASVLPTGYSPDERKKLIDADFEEFKKVFGSYPKSVGAWWIDASSLGYMQQKYGISNAMIVADQYSTDSYQIWGQYWETPYYPAKNNALFPAQSMDNKIPLVITQWATRDPVNGYGSGVEESTLSVQANDYLDYHNLTTDYFSKLVDIYTNQKFNQFNHLVVGLENSYRWSKYKEEYQKQIESLVKKKDSGQLQIVTLGNFANWYQQHFPQLSPEQIVIADDPLGSNRKAVWYMNNFYRLGWAYNNQGSLIRDLRQYVVGQEEICLKKSCNEVNFATFATRVLDQVTYNQKIILDEGKISNFNVSSQSGRYQLIYVNQAGKARSLEFLPRDLDINGKISTIDGVILEATTNPQNTKKQSTFVNDLSLKTPLGGLFFSLIIFLFSFLILVFLPGWVILSWLKDQLAIKSQKIFLSIIIGLVIFTLTNFVSQLFFHSPWLVPILIIGSFITLIYKKIYLAKIKLSLSKAAFIKTVVIMVGTFFLLVPTFRSGLVFGYGMGFWGPNGHDGIWHLALTNQLTKGVPPQNPILAGEKLINYHYFYDLLLSTFVSLTKIPAEDLLFRFFPLIFGILLGLGTLVLVDRLYLGRKKLLAEILSLYLVYSCGSFGWIVDFLKNRSFNGESAFWASQSISFNLNPPFIISLLILVALWELLLLYSKSRSIFSLILLIVIGGSLLEFKAYAQILFVLSLATITIFRRSLNFVLVLIGVSIVSLFLLLPSYPSLISVFLTNNGTFIFSPFWLIDSMIDSPDRLGLTRITLMRLTGLESQNWFKFLGAELIGLMLFIIGNLGFRVLGFFEFAKIRKEFSKLEFQLIFFLSLFAMIIPILFSQKGTPWNTIQFLYYFFFLGSILSGIWVAYLLERIPRAVGVTVLVLILILSPINSVVVAQGYLYPQPHTFVSAYELEGLKFLVSQPEGVVLTPPDDKNLKRTLKEPFPLLSYDTSSYVSALSNKPTFVEDQVQQEILATDYKARLIEQKDFFLGRSIAEALAFLRKYKISYIYLPKIYQTQLDQNQLQLRSIFSNNEVEIFKVQ